MVMAAATTTTAPPSAAPAHQEEDDDDANIPHHNDDEPLLEDLLSSTPLLIPQNRRMHSFAEIRPLHDHPVVKQPQQEDDEEEDDTMTVKTSGAASSSGLSSVSSIRRSLSMGGASDSAVTLPRSTRAWQQHDRLEAFTINKLQFQSLGLYGRHEQTKVLKETFDRLLVASKPFVEDDDEENSKTPSQQQQQQQPRDCVLLSGPSGTGKSSLAKELELPCQRAQGFFVEGKFDLTNHDQPYSGIATACRSLCEQIVGMQHREHRRYYYTYEQVRSKLWNKLENEQGILTELIPSLKEIMGFAATSSASSRRSMMQQQPPSLTQRNLFQHHPDRIAEEDGDEEEEQFPRPPQLKATPSFGKRRSSAKDGAAGTVVSTNSGGGGGGGRQSGTANRKRFHYAFSRLLQVIASFGPVILVLHDLQWADEGTLNLLLSLLQDTELTRVLLVGCYRNQEIPPDHLLASTILHPLETSAADSWNLTVHHLVIPNLTARHVHQMVADVLRCELPETQELASIVYSKTYGNPFYVIQFLKSLETCGLVTFNLGSLKWTWKDQDVRSKSQATSNVVDLVRDRLEDLPWQVRMKLPIAASLGAIFDGNVVQLMAESMGRKLLVSFLKEASEDTGKGTSISDGAWMSTCVEEGLMEPTAGDCTFRFIHDKVQEAAIAMVLPEKLSSFNFLLGSLLMEYLTEEELDKSIFVVVNLLLDDLGLIAPTDSRRIAFSELYFQAGKKAMTQSAFESANRYLRTAIDMLPHNNNPWKHHSKFCLDLYSTAAEASLTTSEIAVLEEQCRCILRRGTKPCPNNFRAYVMLVEGYIKAEMLIKAQNLCIALLKQIGISFPKNEAGKFFQTAAGLIKLKNTIRKTSVEDIQALPEMSDDTKRFGMRILENLAECSMFTGSKLLPIVLQHQLSWTLSHGHFDNSGACICALGIIFTFFLGDPVLGRKCIDLSEALPTVPSYIAREYFVKYGLILHSSVPYSECMKGLVIGYQNGMEFGDFSYALWCIECYLELARCSGKPLELIEEDYRVYSAKMKNFHVMPVYHFSLIQMHAIHNLIRLPENGDPLYFPVESMGLLDGNESITKANESAIHHRKIYLGCFFGKYKEAADLAVKYGDELVKETPGSPSIVEASFYGALACISAYRKTPKKKMYLKYARSQAKKFKQAVKQGNPNVAHWSLTLSAELAALKHKKAKAAALFKQARVIAARMGRLHMRALIGERYGYFLEKIVRDREEAMYEYSQSLKLYHEWGALAKVEQLRSMGVRDAIVDAVIQSSSTRRLMSDLDDFGGSSGDFHHQPFADLKHADLDDDDDDADSESELHEDASEEVDA